MGLQEQGTTASNAPVDAQEVLEDQKASPKDHRFDVFLSYSRKDEEFARNLEEALKNYRLPKDVKTSRSTKNRLTVFRDKHDLVPIAGDYWKTIENYLERSAYLVIVCSPNARRSEYVNHEIKTFLRTHEAKAVIPILLSGRPNNDAGAAPDDYAFPEALCGAFTMPLAVEFSEFPQARGKINKGRYHDSWYTLLAKIFEAERAEIERLDAKRQAQRRAIFGTIAAAVIAILSVALVVAIKSRHEAVQQRDQARRLLYASNINLAQRAFESGNIELGRGLLDSYRVADTTQEDLRGFEWYYLWRLYNGQVAAFDQTEGIAFSRDGAVFATATAKALKIWDAASLRETGSITLNFPPNNTNSVQSYRDTSIGFSPNGKTIAYGDSARVALIDVASGSSKEIPPPPKKQQRGATKEHEESAQGGYWNMAAGGTPRFSPDGKLLAVSYACGMVAVFDTSSLNEIIRLGDGPPASYCADFVEFSPDGRLLAYGDGYSVRLWDTVSGRDLGSPTMDVSLPDSVDQVEAIAFSPDSKLLAIGDRSKQLVLWNIATKKVLGRLKGHTEWISAIAFSADGNTLYTGSVDQTVKLWDFSSYQKSGRISNEIKVFATIKGHTGQINAIRASPAGKIFATVSADGTVKLWSKAAGNEFDAIDNVATISPSLNLFAQGEGESLTLFGLRGDDPVKLASMEALNPTLSPDGKTFATTSYDGSQERAGTIKFWDLNTDGKTALRAQFTGHSPTFSPDGKLFMALGSDGKSLNLWDTGATRQLTPITNDAALKDYLISQNGKIIVTVDKGARRIKSWDSSSGKQIAYFDSKANKPAMSGQEGDAEEPVRLFVLSPDGKLLAVTHSNEVALWKTDSKEEPVLLGRHENDVRALAFSPDGKFIASGDEVGRMKVWDAVSRRELATFAAYKDAVNTLAFSPDGKTLASGGSGSVKLYGMASMRELITLTHERSPTSGIHALQGGEDTVLEILFSADGKSLVTRSGNGIMRIWRGANAASISVRQQ